MRRAKKIEDGKILVLAGGGDMAATLLEELAQEKTSVQVTVVEGVNYN